MTGASFWLRYYSGTIKATLVLACILSATLIAIAGLSVMRGLLVATATAIAICGGPAVLQRWVINRGIRSTRVVDHPELGRIRVSRDHWNAEVHLSDSPYPCTLLGTSASGIPTQEQLSLWRAVHDELQPLLTAAHRTLATELRPRGRPAKEPSLSAIMFLSPDGFVFFLTSRPHKHPKQGFFVRYKNMSVVEAGRTPWKRPRGTHEG
jgi:hypothetical protein